MASPPVPPYPQYAPPYPAPYPYPPPWYPPPKKDESKLALIIIIVVVVVIVVPIVLAAVLYVMVSGLIGTPNGFSPPSVVLSTVTACGPMCWGFSVAGISATAPLVEFRVALLVNFTSLGTLPLANGPMHDDGFHRLQFADVNGDAQLTAGDEFRLDNQGGPSDCEVSLVWAPTGGVVSTVQWRC